MKITSEQIKNVLQEKPIMWGESDIREILSILGLTVKEFFQASLSEFKRFEIHHKRFYLFKVEIDNSRCVSFNNEYVNFGEGCHGISFGGTDTVKDLIQLIVPTCSKMDKNFDGQISFNPDESEYTEEEFMELVQTLNEEIFHNAQ
jgi:hypothetical protein